MTTALADTGKILSDLKKYLDSDLFTLYFYLVQGAAKRPKDITCGTLLTGHVIFPMRRATSDLHAPRSTLYRRIERLEKMGLVQWIRHGRCAILSVIALAHPEPRPPIAAEDTQTPARRKAKARTRATFPDDAPCMRLACTLIQYITLRLPHFKEPNLQSWAYEADLLLRVDKRPYDEADKVLRYSQRDPFWQNQILSLSNLRKHYDRLALRIHNEKPGADKGSGAERNQSHADRRGEKLRLLMEKYA